MYFLQEEKKKKKERNDISHGINSIGLYIEQIWFSSFTISASEKNKTQSSSSHPSAFQSFKQTKRKMKTSHPNQKLWPGGLFLYRFPFCTLAPLFLRWDYTECFVCRFRKTLAGQSRSRKANKTKERDRIKKKNENSSCLWWNGGLHLRGD